MLEFGYLPDKLMILSNTAKSHHRFNHCPVVPTPVKKYDLSRIWQLLYMASEIPLTLLDVRWFVKGYHPHRPGIEISGESSDGTSFASSIPAFKNNNYEVNIGKVKLLRIINRISPAVADFLMKKASQ